MAFQDPLRSGTAASTPTTASPTVSAPVQDAAPAPAPAPAPEPEPASGYAPDGGHRHDINGSASLLEQLRPVPRIAMHAWCETEGVARPVIRAGEDRRMAKVTAKVEPGGIGAAAESYQYAATPNLLIVETRAEPGRVMAELEPLAEVCDPSTKVVVIGHYNDIGLYRELIRSGISEYLVAPVSVADVIAMTAGIFVDPEAEPLGRTIAFVGARGGTGASTICHNVAFAASRLFGSEVVIADLDLPFGTANIDFDRDPTSGRRGGHRRSGPVGRHLSRPPARKVLGQPVPARGAGHARQNVRCGRRGVQPAYRRRPARLADRHPRRAACVVRVDEERARPRRRGGAGRQPPT